MGRPRRRRELRCAPAHPAPARIHPALPPCSHVAPEQEVQPSRDVARIAHKKEFAKHEEMLASLAALRMKGQAGGAK